MPKDDRPPAFLLYVDDFTSDGVVELMTTEEIGAYFLLLCKAWREDPPGSIPANDHVLARWTRLSPNRWAECRTSVLAAFTLGTDDRWHQKRMRREFTKWIESSKKRSRSASAAAKARWHPPPCGADAGGNANALLADAIALNSHSPSGLELSFNFKLPERFKNCLELINKWRAYFKNRTHQTLSDIALESCLMKATRDGWDAEKLNQSIEFSMSKNAKSWLNPDLDYEKQRSNGEVVSGETFGEEMERLAKAKKK